MFENDEEEFDMHMKTISLQEYKILMNLIPEVEKLRNSIKMMNSVIQSKDSQLKQQKKSSQRDQVDLINVSHLSEVSIHFDFLASCFKATINIYE